MASLCTRGIRGRAASTPVARSSCYPATSFILSGVKWVILPGVSQVTRNRALWGGCLVVWTALASCSGDGPPTRPSAGEPGGAGGETGSGGAGGDHEGPSTDPASGAGAGGAGRGGETGAGGAAEDGGAGGVAGAYDPVRESELDSTLQGHDDDANGVRDDVDRYIQSLGSNEDERAALTGLARELTSSMLLGNDPDATRATAWNQQVRVVLAIDCLATLFERDERRAHVSSLTAALFNNRARLVAYHTADGLLSGSVLPKPATGCTPEISGVSR
jgi:hypothetical protein